MFDECNDHDNDNYGESNSNVDTSKEHDDNMSPDERLQWLRERGVLVETPEERRVKEVANIMKEKDDIDRETVSFVYIPHDSSRPMKELSFQCPLREGDGLLEHLNPIFQAMSRDKEIDLELLRGRDQLTLSSSSDGATSSVSAEALKQVAARGGVETFSLVHATASNHYTGVTIYLDETGMLKRLPLNPRATDLCARAGYNPAPQFYGNVFVGRYKARPYIQNIDFKLGVDTAVDAPWLKQAVMDNLEHQTAMNALSGRKDVRQAAVDGTDGAEKTEDGYTWTQTEEELELVVVLPEDCKSKDVAVKYMPQKIDIKCRKEPLLSLELFERVDPDGCTWTLDRSSTANGNDAVKLIITMEKVEQALWPRIKD